MSRVTKKLFVILVVILFLLSLIVLYNLFFAVNIKGKQSATAFFQYGDKDIVVSLTRDETLEIRKILEGHFLYSDNPSCGFSDKISIKFGEEETFCIARDNCAVIYWKEKGRYFSISKNQKNRLVEILSMYGFNFPCV